MKSLKSILALGAFFVVAVGLSACGSGVPGDAVANMAGNPISTQAFNHWMYVAAKGNAASSPGAPVIVPTDPPAFKGCVAQVRAQIPTLSKQSDSTVAGECKQLFTSLSTQVMDFLIRASWYQAEAYKQHIHISNAQVQTAFESAKKQQFPSPTAFQSFLTSSGQTLQDIMFRVRINQIYAKLLAKHQTTVSQATIQAYYNSHASQFGTSATRDMRIIRTNSLAQANAAKAALKKGQSWNTVAKKYSVDTSTKDRGGLLTHVTPSSGDPGLAGPAFKATANKIVGPVHGQFGYYVFEVTKIHNATREPLAKATALIKQILTGQRQTGAQAIVDNQAKKDWLHKTSCQSNYSMADCNGYKPPKATTTPTATTTPPATTTPTAPSTTSTTP